MDKRKANILLAVLGTIVVCILILVAGGAWFALSVFHRETADDASARAAFEAARNRFAGMSPVFEMQAGGPTLTRPVPGSEPQTRLRTLHVIVWDSDAQTLTRADVPLALLRLRDSPIDVFQFSNGSGGRSGQAMTSIRLSELERFGSALLVDEQGEDGHRLLVWTE
jgi:hypothetical protein